MDTIIAYVREGDIGQVRAWLNNIENDVNQGDEHGFTLLHWAAREGQYQIIELLINRGARINVTNMGDDTILHVATAHNQFYVVKFLLENFRLSINLGNEHGNTPLHYACFWNYENICKELIKHGGLITQENVYLKTPLELARPKLVGNLVAFAQTFNQNVYERKPCKKGDANWIKTRAKKSTLFHPIDNENMTPKEIQIEKPLSPDNGGHSGQVLKGYFKSNPIVVKMLKVEVSDRNRREFNEEFKRLKIFNHSNILPVLCTVEDWPQLCLVSEYMPYGSLYHLLHSDDQEVEIISKSQALRFALDIARAMEFLHNSDLRITNFRLNSKHILICEDISKIGNEPSEFEISDRLMAKLNMNEYVFSFMEKAREYEPAWMSPEALEKPISEINLQARDMWSFGVILWELETRQIPFGHLEPMVIGMQIAMEHLRLGMFPSMDRRIVRLLKLCMNDDSGRRPRFDMLITLLEKMKDHASACISASNQQLTSNHLQKTLA